MRAAVVIVMEVCPQMEDLDIPVEGQAMGDHPVEEMEAMLEVAMEVKMVDHQEKDVRPFRGNNVKQFRNSNAEIFLLRSVTL